MKYCNEERMVFTPRHSSRASRNFFTHCLCGARSVVILINRANAYEAPMFMISFTAHHTAHPLTLTRPGG